MGLERLQVQLAAYGGSDHEGGGAREIDVRKLRGVARTERLGSVGRQGRQRTPGGAAG